MELTLDILDRLLDAFVQSLVQPFYLIGILFVAFQYHKQIQLERKLFSTRLHFLLDTTWRTLLGGIIAGFLGSVVMAFVGASLTPAAVLWLWGTTIVLALLRLRFLCMAYAVGVLGLLNELATLLGPSVAEGSLWPRLLGSLEGLPMPSLIALAAVLHLIEAFLVRWQGSRMAMPLFVENKRGRMVGSYRLQQFWPVPLFLLVPMASGGATVELPWTPLLGDALWTAGWGFIAFPAMLGYAESTMSRLPGAKAAGSAIRLAVYGVVVLGLALLAEWQQPLIALASFGVIALHEAVVWLGRREEAQEMPRFVHGPAGLTILAVLPNGPAADMGLEAGEIIVKVNGTPVRTRIELYQALSINPAYCKLEVLNLEGHSKFVNRALFMGDHHQLGVILCPDESARYYVSAKESSLLGLWKRPWKGARSRPHPSVPTAGETV
ncbi:PDZ domain-containing protein [Paenibacillus koleovorans]|uniref:PDZ domain-containing protein n=1 Tax=Paenibacillus koleovorans TaxID=121608 RepID=UPI000FD8AA7D|nr:PDZ domain-containing protein [Paenibacillus koleovorans]